MRAWIAALDAASKAEKCSAPQTVTHKVHISFDTETGAFQVPRDAPASPLYDQRSSSRSRSHSLRWNPGHSARVACVARGQRHLERGGREQPGASDEVRRTHSLTHALAHDRLTLAGSLKGAGL